MSITDYYRSKRALIGRQMEEREFMLAAGICINSIQELLDEDCKAWKADKVYWIHNEYALDDDECRIFGTN